MARIGIIFGLLLCGLTCAGLMGTTSKSPIQFIPMMLGIPALFCGVVALNPHRRKHAMRVAAAVAVVGFLIGGSRSVFLFSQWMQSESEAGYVVALNGGLFLISCLFLVVYVGVQLPELRKRDKLQSDSIPISPPESVPEVQSREIA